MSGQEILLTILIAAMVLAIWVDFRLGNRAPSTLITVLMHGAGAFAIVQIASTLGGMAIGSSMLRLLVGLLVIILPAWMYAFLAMIWATKLARNAIRR